MKKLKHEAELVKAALLAGMKYGEERGAVEFEPTDSANERIQYIYRLLVHDQKIQPLPEIKSRSRACGTSWHCGMPSSCRRTIRC
jgi:hypothetical protein